MCAHFPEGVLVTNRTGSIFQPVNIGEFQPRPALAAPELTFIVLKFILTFNPLCISNQFIQTSFKIYCDCSLRIYFNFKTFCSFNCIY